MYHSVLKSRQSKYIVSPQQIENDFSAYHKMGYTPVFLREVVNFVDGKGALPAKPMVITFDDGHFNNMHYVLPIAKKFNFKIVINPVTSYSVVTQEKNEADNPSYSYLTLAQTAELEQSGLVEIGNHTHNMHKFNPRYGIKQRSSESETDYMSAVESDINRSQNLFISAGVTRPITFAYPFGAYNEIAKRILTAMGFRALLTCNEGISKITLGDPTSLHYLKRYNRSGNTTTEAFIKKVFAKIENSAVPE
jgi:peptidoglycan/xylan/chitin deacetylase (PgdA/CDA1 family)